MLVAIALVVRLGGRIYAGALLRTSGKTKLREALPRPSASETPRARAGCSRFGAQPAAGSRAAWACSWATR